jgi:predicted DNA-binding transcriptional regulator AlpA
LAWRVEQSAYWRSRFIAQACHGMSRTSIYRDMQAGLFPKQIAIGANAVACDSDEIEQWQQAKLAAARAGNTTPTGASKG